MASWPNPTSVSPCHYDAMPYCWSTPPASPLGAALCFYPIFTLPCAIPVKSTPHQCPLESVASYPLQLYADGRTFRWLIITTQAVGVGGYWRVIRTSLHRVRGVHLLPRSKLQRSWLREQHAQLLNRVRDIGYTFRSVAHPSQKNAYVGFDARRDQP